MGRDYGKGLTTALEATFPLLVGPSSKTKSMHHKKTLEALVNFPTMTRMTMKGMSHQVSDVVLLLHHEKPLRGTLYLPHPL